MGCEKSMEVGGGGGGGGLGWGGGVVGCRV